MRRDHVASTLIRRHFDVVCPLGWTVKSCFLGKVRNMFQYVVCWKFCPAWQALNHDLSSEHSLTHHKNINESRHEKWVLWANQENYGHIFGSPMLSRCIRAFWPGHFCPLPEVMARLEDTLLTLSTQTEKVGERVQTQIRRRRRVFTVCHSMVVLDTSKSGKIELFKFKDRWSRNVAHWRISCSR